MTMSGITSTNASTATSTAAAATAPTVDKNEFLQLLVAQLQHQRSDAADRRHRVRHAARAVLAGRSKRKIMVTTAAPRRSRAR